MKHIYFTITGTDHYFGQDFFKPDMKVTLVKEPDNTYDREATRLGTLRKVTSCMFFLRVSCVASPKRVYYLLYHANPFPRLEALYRPKKVYYLFHHSNTICPVPYATCFASVIWSSS